MKRKAEKHHRSPKQFCSTCGKDMKREYVDMHYDIDTGRQKFNIIWRCPEKRWWNCHSKWKSDENGDTYAFEI